MLTARVRVKERIIIVPGQAIGQGSGPRKFVTGGAPNRPPKSSLVPGRLGGNLILGARQAGGKFDPNGPPKKLLGAGVSKF